jgi:hypothetical protein
LLDHINAATRNTILGTPSPFGFSGEKDEAMARKGTHKTLTHSQQMGATIYALIHLLTPPVVSWPQMRRRVDQLMHGTPSMAQERVSWLSQLELEVEVLDDRDPACVY